MNFYSMVMREIDDHFRPAAPPAPPTERERLDAVAEHLDSLLTASDLPTIRRIARQALALARVDDAPPAGPDLFAGR